MRCLNPRSRSRARLWSGVAVTAASAVLLAGCGSTVKNDSSGSGDASTPGVDKSAKTINVAAMYPLSGPIGVAGQGIAAGLNLYFKTLNETGGVGGEYKVTVDAEDSQYNTQIAVPIYNRIKDKTAIFAGLLGTDILHALEPQLESDNMMTVVDASSETLQQGEHFLPYGISIQVNTVNLVSYAVNKLNLKDATYCSITNPDDNGEDSRQGMEFAVKTFGVKFGVDVQPPSGTQDYTPFVKKLQSAGCGVVEVGMTTAATTGIVTAASQLDFTPQWLGQSNTYTAAFAKSPIGPYMAQHWLTTLIGVPWESDAPAMKAIRDAVDKYAPDTTKTNWIELGWAHGMFIAAVLDKAVQDGDLSRAGIAKATSEVGDFDYGGLLPSFGYFEPGSRKPALESSIYKVDPSSPSVLGLTVVAEGYQDPAAADYKSK
jgi:ABC-type branched-subunit amino acid transport system substrate-binding protein